MAGGWAIIDASNLGQGLEIATKKTQTTNQYTSTTSNTKVYSPQMSYSYNLALGQGSNASSSSSPSSSPYVAPSISVIPTSSSGQGTGGSTSPSSSGSFMSELQNNLTGVAVVGVIAYFVVSYFGKKKK